MPLTKEYTDLCSVISCFHGIFLPPHTNWMAWCKTFPWQKKSKQRGKKPGEKFFIWTDTLKKNYPLRSHAFITCPTTTHIKKGAESLKNGFLLFRLLAFIVHASIFCPCFSQSAKRPKEIQGNVLLLNWKAHAKIQALLKKKISPKKVTYVTSCTKPFNYPYTWWLKNWLSWIFSVHQLTFLFQVML